MPDCCCLSTLLHRWNLYYAPHADTTRSSRFITVFFCSFPALSATPHRCSQHCLGPLTFHHQAVGEKVRLSDDGRLAERTQQTFRNGVVFSSRPVKVQEKVRLRVLRDCPNWNGALRLGFTNVPPQNRSLPLPSLVIPDLTEGYGHWAAPMPDACCRPGSELEFWVTSSGKVYVTIDNRIKHKLLKGVDVTRPLWAMIDIYGQTSSIYLLGKLKNWSHMILRALFYPAVLHDSYEIHKMIIDFCFCRLREKGLLLHSKILPCTPPCT